MELEGTVATLGRDPTCDLVLNDPKCSRRHAVVEAGPQGMFIRDSGSANGIFLNGRKTERASIKPGDVVQVGDVRITVLPEDIAGTVVMEEIDAPGSFGSSRARPQRPPSPPGPPREPPAPRPGPSGAVPRPEATPRPSMALPMRDRDSRGMPALRRAGVDGRPLTVSVLSVLWLMSLPLYAVSGLLLAREGSGLVSAAWVIGGLAMALLAGLMAWALWSGQSWARVAQIVIAALGIFVCPFTLASIAVLVYMLRPATRSYFARGEHLADDGQQSEAMYAAAVVGLVALGALLVAALTFMARTARSLPPPGAAGTSILQRARGAGIERAAAAQVRAVAAAEDAFHVVCNSGYADLAGLFDPASVIPNYPPGGPAFLPREPFAQEERAGYRFQMNVNEEMPPSPGCPTRRFRRYQYAATPVGLGRHLGVGADGVLRVADSRPATGADPPYVE